MTEQPTHTTDRPGRSHVAPASNGVAPADLPPVRCRIATFTDYADAERAVDKLAEQDFPVTRVAIVGHDLESIEQPTHRLGWASSAGYGALSGALPGLLIGWIFGLFSWVDPLIASLLLALYGLIIGAVLGAVMGVVAYALQRGRRDFASITVMRPRRFDLVADREVAAEAVRLLAEEV